MSAGPKALAELPGMLHGLAITEVEVIEPLPVEFGERAGHPASLGGDAVAERAPRPEPHHPPRPGRAGVDRRGRSGLRDPRLRHAPGETDTSGYPEYDAIVGGVVSHWDEATGDMIVRAVVGWGGKGVRGDTDRTAAILASLLTNILASQHAVGFTPVERPVPGPGGGGLVCAHCGFASAHERAFYCPKCGMRMLRG